MKEVTQDKDHIDIGEIVENYLLNENSEITLSTAEVESVSLEKEGGITYSTTTIIEGMIDPMISFVGTVTGILIIVVVLNGIAEVALQLRNSGTYKKNSSKKIEDQSYDKVTYRQAKEVIQLFSSYNRFRWSMLWFLYINRKKYLKKIAPIFSLINDSGYKEDVLYQYEIIQLFPQKKQLDRLLQEDQISKLLEKIKILNENYWSVDF